MPGWLLDVLTIAAVVTVLRARPAYVLTLLITALVVVPPTLVVPHTHTPYATFTHVLTAAGLIRLLTMRVDRTLVRGVMRRTPAHYALVGVVVLTFTFGVVFVAQAGALGNADARMGDLLQQVAFFVVCLALIRQLDDVDVALRAAAVAAILSGSIGIIEHISGNSWGHWLFLHATQGRLTNAATPLLARSGQLRVKGGAEFALQYGWLMVMLLPAVVLASLRNRWTRITMPVGVAIVSLSVYWCYTRSALAGLLLVLVVLALAAREWRVLYGAGLCLVGFAAAVAVHPTITSHVSEKFGQGSVTTRFERIAPVLQSVASHPFRGLGLGQLLQSGFKATDNAFLLNYVELGAIGVAILVVLLIVVLAQCGRGLALPDDDGRTIAAACMAAVVAYVVSAMFYDAFSLLQGICLLWVYVAIATVVIEQRRGPIVAPKPSLRLVAATAVVGVGLGFGAYALAPVHVATDELFTTLPGFSDAFRFEPSLDGTVLNNTACTMAEVEDRLLPHASFSCTQDSRSIGLGQIHAEADSRAHLDEATGALAALEPRAGVKFFTTYPFGPPASGRRTVWTTAPAWVPIGLLGLLTLVPWRRRPGSGLRAEREPRLRARGWRRRSRDPAALWPRVAAGH